MIYLFYNNKYERGDVMYRKSELSRKPTFTKEKSSLLQRLIAFIVLLIFLFQPIAFAANETVNTLSEIKTQEAGQTGGNAAPAANYPEANTASGSAVSGNTASESAAENAKAKPPKEVLEKKPDLPKKQKIDGEKVKVNKYSAIYKTGKNTYKEVVSAIPNTYTDRQGKEQEYDNTLIKDKSNDTVYTNAGSDMKVQLPQNITKEERSICREE